MCGICGVYGLEDKELIRRMAEVIGHRGPDDSGFHIDNRLMLGHRRLSIIDLETGKQPIYNEDKSIVIVYNGEIYNFKELRAELEGNGHKFYTNSDTEVIVHAYEEFGEDCVKRFNGIFAFAIWDSNNKKLFLARDRAGIKPLFYTSVDGVFLFASEVKSLLQYSSLKRELDLDALHYFINLRYVPKEKTMFKGVKKLLPGHVLVYKDGKVEVRKYWELEIGVKDKLGGYFEKLLKETIEGTIKRQMIADVPVAAYLSGGLDSSTIVAFASKFTDKLQTFCMGFDEPTDEFNDAKKIAEQFGTEHKELIVKFDIVKTLPETIWAIDMPKRNMWPYFIAQKISKYVKVVLSGMGGDEVLGGYIYRYNFVNEVEKLRKLTINRNEINNEIKKIILSNLKNSKGLENSKNFQSKNENVDEDYQLKELFKIRDLDDNAKLYSLITHNNKLYSDPEYLKKVYGDKLLKRDLPRVEDVFKPYFNGKNGFIEQTFSAEFNTKMVDDFLLVEDATSMAHSLESRVPFLDNEMIDLCFGMPTNLKIRNGVGKYILRKIMAPILPKEIINKKKWGFIPNTHSWFKNEFRDIALQKLPSSFLVKEGYFKKDFIMKILEHKPDDKLNMHYNFIWNLLCFDVWHNIYIKGDELFRPKLDIDYLLG